MENNKTLSPGTVLRGKTTYRIERVLGAGGFGITYLASCEALVGSLRVKAFVAVKEHFLSSYCERDSDTTSVVCPGTQDSRALVANSLRDFIAEARRLADYGAGHPNIVKVNEIFEANGTAYYVMEYLEGKSLSDFIRERGPLAEADIASLVYPIVDAVAFLHSKCVTHLDIKPGNIMLADVGDGSVRPVLIDFGLSKHYNADGSATSTVNTMACSDGFAPAEQYMGIRTFSPAADVYALGATMLNGATGRNPRHAGEWPVGEPAATIAALPLSEQLRTAMTRAMAYRKEDRYPDAGAMLAALGIKSARTAGVLTEPLKPSKETKPLEESVKPMPVAPATRPNRKMIIAAAVAAVVIIGAILGFTQGRGYEPVPTPDRVIGDTIIAEVIEPAVAPEPAQPAGPTPEEIAAAERQEQEAAERERQRQETINGLTVNWGSGVTPAQKDVLRRLIENMVYVSGGTFTMGASSNDSEAFGDEKPVHQVTLSSYRIGRYEVTQKEWETVMGSNPSYFRGDNLPVEKVSWTDCQDFIRRLNGMTGLNFRLPTEAQWEYAARGGNRSNGYKYSGGNNIGSVAWYEGNSGSHTHPVGQKSANELGLYDMTGNVWEWCSDWYGSYGSSSASNPVGPSSGSYRVHRGGSWSGSARYCRVSLRGYVTPGNRYYFLGFRLAL